MSLWLVVASLPLFFPTSSMAHGILIRAMPSVNSQVSEAPREIRLWFNESIERRFSQVRVHRALRHPTSNEVQPQERVDTGLSTGTSVTRELAVALPETLPPGLYLVKWKVFSIDSHRTTGSFTLNYDPTSAK